MPLDKSESALQQVDLPAEFYNVIDEWIELRHKIRNQEVPLRQLQRETAFSGVSGGLPEVGLEPTRPCGHGILNPARLPIPPLRRSQFYR